MMTSCTWRRNRKSELIDRHLLCNALALTCRHVCRHSHFVHRIAEKLQEKLPNVEATESFVKRYVASSRRGKNEIFLYSPEGTMLRWSTGKSVRSLVGAAEWLADKVACLPFLCSPLPDTAGVFWDATRVTDAAASTARSTAGREQQVA